MDARLEFWWFTVRRPADDDSPSPWGEGRGGEDVHSNGLHPPERTRGHHPLPRLRACRHQHPTFIRQSTLLSGQVTVACSKSLRAIRRLRMTRLSGSSASRSWLLPLKKGNLHVNSTKRRKSCHSVQTLLPTMQKRLQLFPAFIIPLSFAGD